MKFNTSRKMDTVSRIIFAVVGTILLVIDAVILYILYGAATWISAAIAAPPTITLLLLFAGGMIFGSIIVCLLVFGLVGLYVGAVG